MTHETGGARAAVEIDEVMKQGLAHHKSGRLAEAESHYRRVLDAAPDHAQALQFLGVVIHQMGRSAQAAELIGRALVLDASRPDAFNNMANVLNTLGRYQEALDCCDHALRLAPEMAPAHSTRAMTLSKLGRYAEAEEGYARALTLQPKYAEARNNLGALQLQTGKLDEAEATLRNLLRDTPDNVRALYNLGMTLSGKNKLPEAMRCFMRIIGIAPDYFDAYIRLGATQYHLGRHNDAVSSFRRALDIKPDHAETYNNLGAIYQAQGKLNDALECYLRAGELLPGYVDALNNIGLVYSLQGCTELAADTYRQALAIGANPGNRVRLATLLPIIIRSREDMLRSRSAFSARIEALEREGLKLTDPVREVGTVNFNLAYHGLDDLPLQRQAANFYMRACPALLYTAPHCRPGSRPPSRRRIKVAFISRYLYQHSIGRTTRGIIAHLNKDEFEVHALFVSTLIEDRISNFIREHADQYHVVPASLAAAHELIAGLEFDILFYQDIGMDPFTYFLSFSRLAPVQCTSFGHPVTSGVPTIDYYITARGWEPEDGESHYSERLKYLQDVASVAYYYRVDLPATTRSRRHFGLRDEEHIYVCPQTLFKIHPDMDGIFAAILRSDAAGRVVLIEGPYPDWQRQLRERFLARIPDVADRITFLPQQSGGDFVNLLAVSDVMLDTLHFCGFNTTLEGFSVGLPVVTLPGAYMRGRHTMAFYRYIGLADCVARDEEDYIRIALRLANDRDYRAMISARIQQDGASLWEDINVVREFERVFREMVSEI